MDHGFGKPGGWMALGDHLVQSPRCHAGRLKLKKGEERTKGTWWIPMSGKTAARTQGSQLQS